MHHFLYLFVYFMVNKQTLPALDRQVNELLGYHIEFIAFGSYVLVAPNGTHYPNAHASEELAWQDAPVWTFDDTGYVFALISQYPTSIINDPAADMWYVRIGRSGVCSAPRIDDAMLMALARHLMAEQGLKEDI